MSRTTAVVVLIGLLVIVMGAVGYKFYSKLDKPLGASQYLVAAKVLGGTTAKLADVPTSSLGWAGFYQGNSTTTLNGDTWQQLLSVNGIGKIRLNITARGKTNTSTLYIRPMVSSDGTNFYFPQTAALALLTTTTVASATTTLTTSTPTYALTPSVVTTSVSYLFDFSPVKFIRLMLLGDDAAVDYTDGVAAYIEAEMQESQP